MPDAALHCVFCGAKQPPAPATSGGLAKTVMGYSAQELIEQMKQQQAASRPTPTPAPVVSPAPSNSPYPAPRATGGQDATVMGRANVSGGMAPQPYGNPAPIAPMPNPPTAPMIQTPRPTPNTSNHNPSGGPPPASYPMNAGGGHVPSAGNVAPTLFAQPAPSYPQPGTPPVAANAAPTVMVNVGAPQPAMPAQQKTIVAPQPAPMIPQPMPQPAPQPAPQPVPQPVSHQPSAPAFMPSNTAARVGRPIEPWSRPLRTQMFIWGGLLLLAFVVPVSIDPFQGNWDAILDGEGTAKLPPLIVAAVGLLSIALAAIPTSPAPRALMAALLGLVGVYVPAFLAGMPELQPLLILVGMTLVIPGLLLRTEYRGALLPRLLITIGALAAIAPFVIPDHGNIPIVELFNAVLDAEPVEMKLASLIPVLLVLVLVLSLLAWLPSPSSGLAPVLLWVLLLWPLVPMFVLLVAGGPDKLVDAVTKTPGALLSWVDNLNGIGAAAGKEAGAVLTLMGGAIATGYGVLIAYGTATLVGKKLE
ncbi:MAG: hypothetical protein KF773_00840 [Deltaproteobacteria bacterium]|nr:hypothetical protein [Deltaproteobacteria bacterium]